MQTQEENYFNPEDYGATAMDYSTANGVAMDTSEVGHASADVNDEFDDSLLNDIDFSQIGGGSYGADLQRMNQTYQRQLFSRRYVNRRKPKMPLSQDIGVRTHAEIIGADGTGGAKTISKVIVPDNQKVIVEGIDQMILQKGESCDSVRNIGYYQCKKLKELTIILNNDSPNDFDLELFNPSMPMDYLISTSGNLNNKVIVAGGVVSYSDILFNLLANPTHIVNAKFSYADAGSTAMVSRQIAQPLLVKNKSMEGFVKVDPLNTQLKLDIFQYQPNVLFFDFLSALNRPYIPDGMDVMQYKVLAGASVTFTFFYRQKSLKRFFLKEARDYSKKLM